jgi:ribokinase
MTADGIDAQHVQRVCEPTGRALIGVSASGENSIIVIPGANGAVTGSSLPPSRVVLAQLEVPLAEVQTALTAARLAGALTMLNPAPAQPLSEGLLRVCDIVVPNEHEVELLGGAPHLLALGAKAVVVTRGGDGADLYTAEGVLHVPAFAVTPIDTTAAGDSFCGALAARLAAGDELPVALRFAAAAGALCTTAAGAVPSIPHRSAVDALL